MNLTDLDVARHPDTLAVTINPALAELYVAQGWCLSVWRSFPHRAYSLLAWRTL